MKNVLGNNIADDGDDYQKKSFLTVKIDPQRLQEEVRTFSRMIGLPCRIQRLHLLICSKGMLQESKISDRNLQAREIYENQIQTFLVV